MENRATSGDHLGSARLLANVEETDANGQGTKFVVKDLVVLSAANQHHRLIKLWRPLPKALALFGEEEEKRQH